MNSQREGSKEDRREASVGRRLLAEAVGTFFLTFVAAGGEVVATVARPETDNIAKAVAPGLVVMALVYSLGDVSGAHFNPVVTLAFALRGVFRWSSVPVYWVAQFAGATGAAVGLRAMFGNVGHLGTNRVHFGTTSAAFVTEIVLTLLLVVVVLNTATRARVVGPNAAIAVGGTIALCGFIGRPISGAALNPIRWLGPALVSGDSANAWIYVAGPVVGGIVAVALTAMLHPVKSSDEVDAAEGERDHGPTTAPSTVPS